MFERIRLVHVLAAVAVVLAPLFVVGWLTRQNPGEVPLIDITGGGFVFNYRIAEVFYGFTAVVRKPLEAGAIIEASFEDPASDEPHVVRERVDTRTTRYAMRSPPVRGVEAGREYTVNIRVLDHTGQQVLFATTRNYSSQISDQAVPDKPLTIGPGYHLNPDTSAKAGG